MVSETDLSGGHQCMKEDSCLSLAVLGDMYQELTFDLLLSRPFNKYLWSAYCVLGKMQINKTWIQLSGSAQCSEGNRHANK